MPNYVSWGEVGFEGIATCLDPQPSRFVSGEIPDQAVFEWLGLVH